MLPDLFHGAGSGAGGIGRRRWGTGDGEGHRTEGSGEPTSHQMFRRVTRSIVVAR
ncbi:hypothetical protein GCM10010468_33070 [Actinocorallia longicatena]|uniref:Uncharacterized protein n=1 Tax=Actinocorallia longicatena TaxID=111803 RepID=A0ABP6Q9Y6_9ACTN